MKKFILDNKVFITGIIVALLTSIYELFSTNGEPSGWVLAWSASIAILSYLANNVRGQWASIISVVLSTAIMFFQAHENPDGLTMKEIATTVLLPLVIKILGLFYTAPPKDRAYEHAQPIQQAKAEANRVKENR